MNKKLVYLSLFTFCLTSSVYSPAVQAQSQKKYKQYKRGQKMTREQALEIAKTPVPGMQHSKTLPKNFPIPTYPRKVLRTSFVNSTQGSPTASALIVTEDSPTTVYKWYYSACKRLGWKMRAPGAKLKKTIAGSKDFYMLDAYKGHHALSMHFLKNPNPSEKGTRVNISWAFRG